MESNSVSQGRNAEHPGQSGYKPSEDWIFVLSGDVEVPGKQQPEHMPHICCSPHTKLQIWAKPGILIPITPRIPHQEIPLARMKVVMLSLRPSGRHQWPPSKPSLTELKLQQAVQKSNELWSSLEVWMNSTHRETNQNCRYPERILQPNRLAEW